MKIRRDKIEKEDHNNILEILRSPLSCIGWRLKDASYNLKRDREIVMDAVIYNGGALKFVS